MQNSIQNFLNCKKIAIVGISKKPNKFGNTIAKELFKRGYEIFQIHPAEKELNGLSCYSSLNEIKEEGIECLLISVLPQKVNSVLESAAQIGIKNVWLQQGSSSIEALTLAEKLNLNIVSGKCILMYMPQVEGIHKFHSIIAKLFGKY